MYNSAKEIPGKCSILQPTNAENTEGNNIVIGEIFRCCISVSDLLEICRCVIKRKSVQVYVQLYLHIRVK